MKMCCIFLAFFTIGFSCKKSSTTGGCTPEKNDYNFKTGRKIDYQRMSVPDSTSEYYSYTVEEGDSTVFTHTLVFSDCPELADDEGSRVVVFEIPPNVNSFRLEDSADLRSAKVLISVGCFCPISGPVFAKNGTIEGQKKSNNRWHVKGSLTHFPGNVAFEGDFVGN